MKDWALIRKYKNELVVFWEIDSSTFDRCFPQQEEIVAAADGHVEGEPETMQEVSGVDEAGKKQSKGKGAHMNVYDDDFNNKLTQAKEEFTRLFDGYVKSTERISADIVVDGLSKTLKSDVIVKSGLPNPMLHTCLKIALIDERNFIIKFGGIEQQFIEDLKNNGNNEIKYYISGIIEVLEVPRAIYDIHRIDEITKTNRKDIISYVVVSVAATILITIMALLAKHHIVNNKLAQANRNGGNLQIPKRKHQGH